MKRTAAICVAIVFSLVCCAYADFGVTNQIAESSCVLLSRPLFASPVRFRRLFASPFRFQVTEAGVAELQKALPKCEIKRSASSLPAP
jgi:hypothetical protein